MQRNITRHRQTRNGAAYVTVRPLKPNQSIRFPFSSIIPRQRTPLLYSHTSGNRQKYPTITITSVCPPSRDEFMTESSPAAINGQRTRSVSLDRA